MGREKGCNDCLYGSEKNCTFDGHGLVLADSFATAYARHCESSSYTTDKIVCKYADLFLVLSAPQLQHHVWTPDVVFSKALQSSTLVQDLGTRFGLQPLVYCSNSHSLAWAHSLGRLKPCNSLVSVAGFHGENTAYAGPREW